MNQETKRRDLALDTNTGRTGEVMDTIDTSHGRRVYLRPPGGGREWAVPASQVTYLERVQ
jgi:hypothetical protein